MGSGDGMGSGEGMGEGMGSSEGMDDLDLQEGSNSGEVAGKGKAKKVVEEAGAPLKMSCKKLEAAEKKKGARTNHPSATDFRSIYLHLCVHACSIAPGLRFLLRAVRAANPEMKGLKCIRATTQALNLATCA